MIQLREWGGTGGVELDAAQIGAFAATDRFALRPDSGQSGRWRLSATQYVGVARVAGLQVTVTPKVGVHRLLELLCSTADRIAWDDHEIDIAEDDHLVSLIARVFARRVEGVLRSGILQGYVTVEEALPALRGRIDMTRQMSRGGGLVLPVELSYDDFTTNIVENRLLLGAAHVLLRRSDLKPVVVQRLRRLGVHLDGVQPAQPSPRPPPVVWTRLNQRYRPAVTLARLILQMSSVDLQGVRAVSGDAFLVDMNRVFEDVVGAGLQRHLTAFSLHAALQRSDQLDHDGHVRIRPDVVVRAGDGGVVAVADMKYKQAASRGLDPGDVYQAVAYAVRYQLSRVTLVFAEPPPAADLQVGAVRVQLRHLDLAQTSAHRDQQLRAIAADVASGAQR